MKYIFLLKTIGYNVGDIVDDIDDLHTYILSCSAKNDHALKALDILIKVGGIMPLAEYREKRIDEILNDD